MDRRRRGTLPPHHIARSAASTVLAVSLSLSALPAAAQDDKFQYDLIARLPRQQRAVASEAALLRGWAGEFADDVMRQTDAATHDGVARRIVALTPASGGAKSSFDPAVRQLLCVLALARFAQLDPGAPEAERARLMAVSLFDESSGLLLRPDDEPFDLVTMTLVRHLYWEQPVRPRMMAPPDSPPAFVENLGQFERVFKAGRQVRRTLDRNGEMLPSVPREGKGYVVFALTTRIGNVMEDAAIAERNVREMFPGATPDELLLQMPWLGWAELRLHPEGPLRSRGPLREMRELFWRSRPELAHAQRIGAGPGPPGLAPPAAWELARRLPFLATMLADQRLTDESEVDAERDRLLAAFERLRRPAANEGDGQVGVGAISASSPETTAMTVISLCEAVQSLERIGQRRDAPRPAPTDPPAPAENTTKHP